MTSTARTRHQGSAPSRRFQPGFRVRLGRRTAAPSDDGLLAGGRPLRLVRLGARGAVRLAPLLRGDSQPVTAGDAHAVERLLDLDLILPDPSESTPDLSQVTVVVPVRDHAAELTVLLRSPQAFSGVAQVVVVDDGSDDPDAIERAASDVEDLRIQVVRCPAPAGPAAARNRGAAVAGTELVAFVDADCRPQPGWLEALVGQFQDSAVGAVAPRIGAVANDAGGRSPLARALLVFERIRGPLEFGPDPASVGPGRDLPLVPSAALLVRRAAFEAVGGFDADLRFGEDNDFEWRLAGAGWTVRYEPKSAVHHPIRADLAAALRQRYCYGLPAAALARRHQGFRMLRVEPATAAALVAAVTVGPAGALSAGLVGCLGPVARWTRLGMAWRPALRRRVADQTADAHGLVLSLAGPYWPLTLLLAVFSRRLRRLLPVVVIGPALVDWSRRRPRVSPVSWVLLHVMESVAGGTGVWVGCIRAASARALVPMWKPVAWEADPVGDGL